MKNGILINKKVILAGLSLSLLLGALGNINCFATVGEFNESQERGSNPSIISFTVDHEAPLRGLQEHEASNAPNLLQGAGVQGNEIADVRIGHFIYNIVRRAYGDTPGEVSIKRTTDERHDVIQDLSRLEIPGEVTISGQRYTVTSIGEWAFSGCTSLRRITIPNSVRSIGMFAFMFCTNLNNITIPDSVIRIGEWAFLGCTSLENIAILNSVKYIGCGAFEDCKSLNNITIPNSVIRIGKYAFRGCTGLRRVTFSSGTILPHTPRNAFANCGVVKLSFPSGLYQYIW